MKWKFLLLVAMLALPMGTIIGMSEQSDHVMALSEYTEIEKILISSNYDVDNYDFPGTGTVEDPYVIEGYNFTGSGTAIDISMTTKSFIIRNNLIDDFTMGILTFPFEGSFIIENNIIRNIEVYGIHGYGLDHSEQPVYDIRDNYIEVDATELGSRGIKMQSLTATIVNNTINGGYDGIFMFYTQDSIIDDNTIMHTNRTGTISYGYENGVTITNNVYSSNNGIDLWAIGAEQVVTNNIFTKGHLDLDLDEFTYDEQSNELHIIVEHNSFLGIDGDVNISINDEYLPSGPDSYEDPSSWYDINHNYYADATGVDADFDGILDTPYQIAANNSDLYPLAAPLEYLAPDIDRPSDISYEEGSTGNIIVWAVSDRSPSMYNVTKDGALYTDLTSWTNGTISIDIDDLAIGTYEFEIFVYDALTNMASDKVSVTVTEPVESSDTSDTGDTNNTDSGSNLLTLSMLTLSIFSLVALRKHKFQIE